MISHCLKCRKNTESKTPKVAWSKSRRIMCQNMCDSKKSIKQ